MSQWFGVLSPNDFVFFLFCGSARSQMIFHFADLVLQAVCTSTQKKKNPLIELS